MRKSILTLSFLLLCSLFNLTEAQEKEELKYSHATDWLGMEVQQIKNPMLNNGANINGKSFTATDFFGIISLPNSSRPAENRAVYSSSDSECWNKLTTAENGVLELDITEENNDRTYYHSLLAAYIESSVYQEVDFKVTSSNPYELYLNGEKILSYDKFSTEKSNNKKVKMEIGKHDIIVKLLYQQKDDSNWDFKLEFNGEDNNALNWSVEPIKNMDLNTVMHGIRLSGASVSPCGNYVKYSYRETSSPKGETSYWSEIIDLRNNNTILNTKHNKLSSYSFHPNEAAIIYRNNNNKKSQVYKQSLENGAVSMIMECSKDMNFYNISDDGKYIIYGINIEGKKNTDGVNLLDGMEDRWPWWRNQTNLYMYDIATNQHFQLTSGNQSTSLHDISPIDRKIIVSHSIRDYKVRPYSKQILMELDLNDFSVDTLWTDYFGGSAQYSPDGKYLLITGSAAMFNGKGSDLNKKTIVNDYDTEAYLFNIENKEVQCISKKFDPNIQSVYWCPDDNLIYMTVEEKSYNNIYTYDINKGIFEEISTELDNVFNISKSRNSNLLAYYGSGIQSPERGFVINTENKEVVSSSNPEEEMFKDYCFGEYHDYTYKTKKGNIIDGYYYLPSNFDSSKKYPMIVYYYGGTSPTGRTFRGLYPKNYFAANGYVVYVIIPSGSTGYGQEFAARHVNNWGITVADEIIESTKNFVKNHDFVDAEHIGCMGASYGGFMTELLTTRTDIFAAAISHAGISSISSYWGEGYWGWGYNSVAAAETFPWNNKEMYVGQSALFNADKINTPLLLLHGKADTNVPVGESIQLYTALKLLGKECEFVELEGEDHHVKDYNKRIKWHKTIMAWWEKHLKEDDSWWNDLYKQ